MSLQSLSGLWADAHRPASPSHGGNRAQAVHLLPRLHCFQSGMRSPDKVSITLRHLPFNRYLQSDRANNLIPGSSKSAHLTRIRDDIREFKQKHELGTLNNHLNVYYLCPFRHRNRALDCQYRAIHRGSRRSQHDRWRAARCHWEERGGGWCSFIV